jgi:hypothetical protein
MDIAENISWRIKEDEASFDYHIEAARRLGKRFDEYQALVKGKTTTSNAAVSADGAAAMGNELKHPPIRFRCGWIVRRVPGAPIIAIPTEPQKVMFGWILEHQQKLVDSVGELVRACYSQEKPEGWCYEGGPPPPRGVKPLPFLGAGPAPAIPEGFALDDFIRIGDVYLNAKVLIFGVRVRLAWSKGHIGLRYEARGKKPRAGKEFEFFRCVGIGPADVAHVD